MGIAAIGSAIVQLSVRDQWIGWHPQTFLDALRARPTMKWARWVETSLGELIGDIYTRDFLKDGTLREHEVAAPTPFTIKRLRTETKRARKAHRLYSQREIHKRKQPSGGKLIVWKQQAETYLFRSKRAAALGDLLEARLRLRDAGFIEPTKKRLRLALSTTLGDRAIRTVLRYVRGKHVGVDMLDITICGAISPYNALLGGKLVSLLMASPEIISAYRNRYGNKCSIIASSIAGRPVIRKPSLVLLGTTSLYSIGSSQYNRLWIPKEVLGSSMKLSFVQLGRTAGFGSYQFSRETLAEIETAAARAQRGREVNSIFGEGVSPKLRKIRSGLDAVGLPSDSLLRHGTSRLVFGIPLATNFRKLLLGINKRPKYIVSLNRAEKATKTIVDFWLSRWMMPRLQRDGVLGAVAANNLAFPITHAARAHIQPVISEADLFSELPAALV
jgi:hypothetical protein